MRSPKPQPLLGNFPFSSRSLKRAPRFVSRLPPLPRPEMILPRPRPPLPRSMCGRRMTKVWQQWVWKWPVSWARRNSLNLERDALQNNQEHPSSQKIRPQFILTRKACNSTSFGFSRLGLNHESQRKDEMSLKASWSSYNKNRSLIKDSLKLSHLFWPLQIRTVTNSEGDPSPT